jgi:FemAB-related protein (PEP-CTERM system-associated)
MNDVARSDVLTVRPFREGDAPVWDAYVHAHPDATFFHLSGWKTVLERAFSHRTYYLLAVAADGTSIRGVLPMALVSSFLFGKSLISLPFCCYGGTLASDEQAQRALEDEACKLAATLNVDYLEMRQRRRTRTDWPAKELYVTFRKPVSADDEANLNAIPRKQRAMVRKGINKGLDATIDKSNDELYAMYSESLRNLGTPVFSQKYLRILQETFGEACEILTVRFEGAPIASVMSFYFRDEVMPYYGGGTVRARDLAANDFMYWKTMQRGVQRGCRLFDYGRSKTGTGSYSFKANWGFEPQQLFYEYHLVRAREVPNLSPTNPKYKLMIDTWQKLPLWLTQRVGPPLARYLG